MILCTPPHFHVKFSVSTGNSATRPTRRRPFKNLTARVIGNTGRQRIIWKSIAKLFTKFVGYMLIWQTWQTELPTTVTKRPRLSSQLQKKNYAQRNNDKGDELFNRQYPSRKLVRVQVTSQVRVSGTWRFNPKISLVFVYLLQPIQIQF